MLTGVHLDNVDSPPESSYRRIRLMRAEVALTLWTAGTRHRHPVYEALAAAGVQRLCIRVGDEGIAGSVDDYLKDVDQAVNEAVAAGFTEDEIDCQLLNEPNLRTTSPITVGTFVGAVLREWRRKARPLLPPVSRGKEGWQDYARAMLGAASPLPKNVGKAKHAYAQDAEQIEPADPNGLPEVVTEFSHPEVGGRARGLWVVERLREFAAKGYGYAVQFIVDGVTGGQWPEGYRMTDGEAIEIGQRGTLPEPEGIVLTEGVDISNNNGVVDFQKLAASGRTFGIAKACEDDAFLDRFLKGNLAGLKEIGWGRGIYHFVRPSTASPAASVTLLQRAADASGWGEVGDIVALDIEDERVPEGTSLHVWAAEWLDLAERVFGVTPWKYSGRWYTRTRDLEHDDLAKYPSWWADYGTQEPQPVTGWGPIRCWQYSADGALPGIAGKVDLNVFHGSLVDFKALGKQGTPEPVPVPNPQPDPVALAIADVRAAVDRLEALVKR